MLINLSNVDLIIDKLRTQSVFVFDIETSGLDVLNDDFLCGIGIGLCDGSRYYFPFRHPDNNLDLKYLKEIFSIFKDSILIGHNIKFDIKGLYHDGFDYSKCTFIDTIVMARLCDTERKPRLDLKSLISKYISVDSSLYKDELKKYQRKNKIKKVSEIAASIICDYCENDIKNTSDLYLIFNKIVKETHQYKLWIQECQVTKVLADMEIKGVKVDLDYCKKCSILLGKKRDLLEKDIYSLSDCEFNIDSSPQLTKVMKKMGIKSPKKTAKNKDSWSQSAMVQLDHPICKKITEYRTISNLKNTFFGPIIEKNNSIVNTSFKNWVAITGRLSCEEPNLQNIPRFTQNVGDEKEMTESQIKKQEFIERMVQSASGGSSLASWAFTGDEFYGDDSSIISARRMFVPREGFSLFSIDYVQMEVVVFLYYIKEMELIQKISGHDFDFHSFIAVEALGADPNDKETFKFMRQIAKGITFGIIYGMGLRTLSIQIGKSIEEAEKFKRKYFEKIPRAEKYIELMTNKVKNGEIIYNDYGRRYVILPERAYLIINYMVQGTSGEIMKEVMIKINHLLNDKKSSMLIQIHDELLFEISNDELYLLNLIEKVMSKNMLGIPMAVDIKKCIGSWASKEEYVLSKN